MRKNWKRSIRWFDDCFGGTEKGVSLVVNLMSSVVLGSLMMGSGLPLWLDFMVFTLASWGVLTLGRIIIERIFQLIFKRKCRIVIYYGILSGVLIGYLISCVERKISLIVLVSTALVVAFFELVFGSCLDLIIHKRRKDAVVIGVAAVTMLGNLLLANYILGKGFDDSYVSTYLMSRRETTSHLPIEKSMYELATKEGDYTVLSLEYGIGKEATLSSGTTNLNYFVNSYTGIKRFIRDRYWGFTFDVVPLQGKVWYPKEVENCPVLFIIHGNHSMTVDSYLGYEYIGNHLASRGYVVVSVDENVLNYYIDQGLESENAGRAALLLENMKQIEKYNQTPDGELYQKMDFNHIALAGHSRGGEAVALATLYNELKRNPDNANMVLDYDFNIESIIAIAPTTNQYYPAGKNVEIKDVNYLLIHGANDQDVTTFMGVKQYNNLSFSGEKECYKVYKYIFGANHGQFNTMWETDFSGIRKFILNQATILERETQRQILLGYVTAFLEDTLQGKQEYRTLLLEDNTEDESMPQTLYITAYEDSSFQPIATYEEDMELDTLTCEEGNVDIYGMSYWKEIEVPFYGYHSYADTDNHAVYLNWKNRTDASYSYQIPKSVFERGNVFTFSVMDYDVDGVKSGEHVPLDFSIEFQDEEGNCALVRLGDYSKIAPPLPVRLYKLEVLTSKLNYKMNFQTVRIPYSEIKEQNPKLQMDRIVKVEFRFDQVERGTILIDQVGVATQK